jgi:hypothetical protein
VLAPLQAQVPHPLTDDVPRLLTASRLTTPTVGVLFLCAA